MEDIEVKGIKIRVYYPLFDTSIYIPDWRHFGERTGSGTI